MRNRFDQDREELLASMKDNGIGTIVDVGSNMESFNAELIKRKVNKSKRFTHLHEI